MAPANCVKVKRDGPRGWHWIAEANYDPSVHVLIDPLDHDGDGRKGGSVPKADPELTDREINADLSAMDIEFDGKEPTPVRMAKRQAGRAKRAAA